MIPSTREFLDGLGLTDPLPLVEWGEDGLVVCPRPAKVRQRPKGMFFPWTERPKAQRLKELWDQQAWPRRGWTLLIPARFGLFWPTPAHHRSRAALDTAAKARLPFTADVLVSDLLCPGMAATFRADEWRDALTCFREAGLTPGRLWPLPALLSQGTRPREKGDRLWVHGDKNGVLLFVFQQGRLVLARGGALRSALQTEWEQWKGRVAEVVLSGDRSFVSAWAKDHPEARQRVTEKTDWVEKGFDLRKSLRFDFLPSDFQNDVFRFKKAAAVKTGVFLVFLFFVAAGAAFLQRSFHQNRALLDIRSRRAAWRNTIGRLEKLDREKSADAHKKEHPALTEVLSALSSLPEGVSLDSLSYDSENGVTLQAMGLNHARALSAVQSLNALGLFRSTRLMSANAVRVFDRDLISFQIEGTWKKDVEETR